MRARKSSQFLSDRTRNRMQNRNNKQSIIPVPPHRRSQIDSKDDLELKFYRMYLFTIANAHHHYYTIAALPPRSSSNPSGSVYLLPFGFYLPSFPVPPYTYLVSLVMPAIVVRSVDCILSILDSLFSCICILHPTSSTLHISSPFPLLSVGDYQRLWSSEVSRRSHSKSVPALVPHTPLLASALLHERSCPWRGISSAHGISHSITSRAIATSRQRCSFSSFFVEEVTPTLAARVGHEHAYRLPLDPLNFRKGTNIWVRVPVGWLHAVILLMRFACDGRTICVRHLQIWIGSGPPRRHCVDRSSRQMRVRSACLRGDVILWMNSSFAGEL